MSKIAQKLVPQFPAMQGMLDTLAGRSDMVKAFVFDVSTKIYVATDSRVVDVSLYEACSDAIDLAKETSSVLSEGMHSSTSQGIANTLEATIPIHRYVLYLRRINNLLAVVAVMDRERFEAKTAVIKANVEAFCNSVEELLAQQ